MATPTYTAIASVTLASDATSITFSSIPQDYRDLIMVSTGTSQSTVVSHEVALNGTTANQSNVRMVGNGSSALSQTLSKINIVPSSVGFVSIVQFMDYSATDKHKTILSRENPGNQDVYAMASRWADTAAITSIKIEDDGGTVLKTGSKFALYGIEA